MSRINWSAIATQLREWLARWSTVPSPQPTAAPKPRSAILLVIAIVLTIFWQRTFEYAGPQLDLTYRITVTAGLFGQDRFYYFYYYLGLFPLHAEGIEPIYSKEGAESIIRDHPESLRTEVGYLIRSGDWGKIWLLSLGAFLKGEPRDLSTLEFNSWFFVLGLIGILVATWYADRFLLGVLMVALIGSHPLQLYEVYADDLNRAGQVFSINISTALLLLAFYIPLIFDRRPPKIYAWLLAVATGIFFATVRQIRSEPLPLIASALMCFALAAHLNWRNKIALILLVLAAFGVTARGWEYYWDAEFKQTTRVVQDAGGTPYTGPFYLYHTFWHPLWVGLGDFGQKYGYVADDVAAHDYATPIMQKEGSLDFEMIGTERSTAWYDDRHLYYKMIWTIPRYMEILRDKVVSDMVHDPLWYLGILVQRTWRILTEVVPVRLGWGSNSLDLPFSGLLLIPTIIALAFFRQWSLLKLVGFVLPLAATALLYYSGNGYTYYSIYPQVLAAIYGMTVWHGARRALKRQAR